MEFLDELSVRDLATVLLVGSTDRLRPFRADAVVDDGARELLH
jgi:hypothetical protein